MSKQHFLLSLAFSATSLAAVHSATFVWLTAFVYHHNIRDYVPAGITGLSLLAFAWLLLQLPLMLVGRRRRRVGSYLFGGFFGVPAAVLLASFFTSALIALLGYSLQKDIAVSSLGAVVFATGPIILFRCYMIRRKDNNSAEPTRAR